MKLARTLALAGAAAFALMSTVVAQQAPKFEIDTSWPKPLPNNWIFGQIGGIFVDKDDNVWISQRPGTVNDRDKRAERGDKAICCYTAPSVVEFNQAGSRRGADRKPQGYDWPQNEHGMFIDYKGNVWLGGNGENDGMVLKFTNDGKFLMSIGKSAKQTNSLDQARVGRAADMVVDQATNELYVADGYFNHRLVVFDADTGAFKRTWGAYGKPPTDEKITYDPKVLPQAVQQSGAWHQDHRRRAGGGFRPWQQPHSGVPQGRYLCARNPGLGRLNGAGRDRLDRFLAG